MRLAIVVVLPTPAHLLPSDQYIDIPGYTTEMPTHPAGTCTALNCCHILNTIIEKYLSSIHWFNRNISLVANPCLADSALSRKLAVMLPGSGRVLNLSRRTPLYFHQYFQTQPRRQDWIGLDLLLKY